MVLELAGIYALVFPLRLSAIKTELQLCEPLGDAKGKPPQVTNPVGLETLVTVIYP